MKRIFLILALAISLCSSEAKVKLPALISDGMVLRSGEARLWGKTDAGKTVTVKPSWGKAKTTVASGDGSWEIEIPTGKASSDARYIDFIDGTDTVRVNDILVGEVWLCTGQSNMVFPIGDHRDTLVWQTGVTDEKEQLADADYPELRLFTVGYAMSPDRKLEDFSGRWVKTTPESAYDFSAVGFIFGRRLHKELRRPVGLIQSAVGATSIESWINPELQTDTMFNYMKRRFTPETVTPRTAHRISGGLWNGMIYPINRYDVTGTIWYQGEGNNKNAHNYAAMMKLMINSWRNDRHQPDMPFYYVQIAPFHDRSPYVREAQLEVLNSGMRNLGMAVITDAGDSLDIHPRDKNAPGERLALIALDKTYHRNVVSESPTVGKVNFKGNHAIVNFKNADGLKTSDGKPATGFQIAGDDRRFHPAKAVIKGNKVIVSSPEVKEPVAVRYGFCNFPRVNLINSSGLPASPFRSDRWVTESE